MKTAAEHEHVFFETPALKGLIQQLVHIAFFGDGIALVVGARGSGKTALAGEMERHYGQAHCVSLLDLQEPLQLADCIEQVSHALGIVEGEAPGAGELLADLRHFVQSLVQDKKLAVLVIDNAHFLDDQALAALLSLLQGSVEANCGLHLLLLSEPGLEMRIDALQIIDVAVYDFQLPAFSPSELAAFLSARADENLETTEVQRLWAGTGGIPGAALQELSAKDRDRVDGFRFTPRIPLGHVAAIALLALVLLWSMFFRGDSPESSSNSVTVPLPPPSEAPPDAEVGGAQTSTTDLEAIQSDTSVEMSPPADAGIVEQVDDALAPSRSAGEVDDKQVAAPAIPGSESAEPAATRAVSPVQVLPTFAPNPTPPQVATLEGDESIRRSEKYLLSQDMSGYVLQVIAASSKASLESFILRQSNRESLYMYRGLREGKSWFVVVQGPYDTRQEALEARGRLPEEQAKGGPWPRKLSSIQEEIETYRRKNR